MADKELRRLKRRELLQMLLMECEEAERLEQESGRLKEQLDALQEQMATIMESYERLKKKLDVKDERLNQKDEKIAPSPTAGSAYADDRRKKERQKRRTGDSLYRESAGRAGQRGSHMRIPENPLEYGGGTGCGCDRDRAGVHQTVCTDQSGRQQHGSHAGGRSACDSAPDRGDQDRGYHRILS